MLPLDDFYPSKVRSKSRTDSIKHLGIFNISYNLHAYLLSTIFTINFKCRIAIATKPAT